MKFIITLAVALIFGGIFTMAEGSEVEFKPSSTRRALAYKLYTPTHKAPRMPLFVVLHGCFLNAGQMELGSGFDKFAEERGFYVLYPEQLEGQNPWRCWNWFKPENQIRGEGELSRVADLVKRIIEELGDVDPTRVFVAGLSAGGAMSSNLIACYSDLFAGALVHSGPEFAAPQTEEGAHEVLKNGSHQNLASTAAQALACSPPRLKPIPVLVVHGSSDTVVNPRNGENVATQFRALNQLIAPRASITQRSWEMPKDADQLSASVEDALVDGKVVVRRVSVVGMGHGWSGGSGDVPFMEPKGPSAAKLAVEFFLDEK